MKQKALNIRWVPALALVLLLALDGTAIAQNPEPSLNPVIVNTDEPSSEEFAVLSLTLYVLSTLTS